jgi:hypothetical protein
MNTDIHCTAQLQRMMSRWPLLQDPMIRDVLGDEVEKAEDSDDGE